MHFYCVFAQKTSIQLRGCGIKDTQKAVTRLIGLPLLRLMYNVLLS